MKDTVNLAIENCDNANGRMKIGIFNSTPISINPVEWPVHYEMVLPVVSIKPNGNDSSLLDMIAENTCKLDMPPAHELGSPVWWKDDLNQLQHYFTKRTSLNLKVRKSKSHGTLMCCETNKENIGTLIQDKIIKFDEIETIVRNMILCHNGSYIDEYSPIITILEAAINHDDLAKSSVIGVTPSGMAQIYNSDDDWELLIEESEIFEGFKEYRLPEDETCLFGGASQPYFCHTGSKVIQISKHRKMEQYLITVHIALFIGYYDYLQPLLPRYACVADTAEEAASQILEIAQRIFLSRELTQRCLNALPAKII